MRIEVHDYIDWNSPGTMDPKRGERAPDEGNGDIDVGEVSPLMAAVGNRGHRRRASCRLDRSRVHISGTGRGAAPRRNRAVCTLTPNNCLRSNSSLQPIELRRTPISARNASAGIGKAPAKRCAAFRHGRRGRRAEPCSSDRPNARETRLISAIVSPGGIRLSRRPVPGRVFPPMGGGRR